MAADERQACLSFPLPPCRIGPESEGAADAFKSFGGLSKGRQDGIHSLINDDVELGY